MFFDPLNGPYSYRAIANDFAALHGLHTDAGCTSDQSCTVSSRIVDQMERLSGVSSPVPNPYLDLLLRGLSGELHTTRLSQAANKALGFKSVWPALATTMVPAVSLEGLRWMIETCVRDNVPARNIFEAGVWRGGSIIYSSAVLDEAIGGTATGAVADPWTVIICDSFRGLPLPSSPLDADDGWWWQQGLLKVPESEVLEAWTRYLPHIPIFGSDAVYPDVESRPRLSARVFKGWVRESMPRVNSSLPPPGTPQGDIAILRIDLDMYEAYTDVLYALAERVPPGGFMVMDDYLCVEPSQRAVDHFRQVHGITETLHYDGRCVAWWRVEKRLRPKQEGKDAFEAVRTPEMSMHAVNRVTVVAEGALDSKIVYEQFAGEDVAAAVKRICEINDFALPGGCTSFLTEHFNLNMQKGGIDYLGVQLEL